MPGAKFQNMRLATIAIALLLVAKSTAHAEITKYSSKHQDVFITQAGMRAQLPQPEPANKDSHHVADSIHEIVARQLTVTTTGECGATVGFTCDVGYCCSQYGYCGNTAEFCGAGCQPAYGTCDTSASSTPTRTPSKASPSRTPTKTLTPSRSLSKTGTPSKSPPKSGTPTTSPTKSRSLTPTPTRTASASKTASKSLSPTRTQSKPSQSSSCTRTASPSETSSQSLSESASVTPTTGTPPSGTPSIAPTYSIDDTCGVTKGACQPDNCCSEFGYCGTTDAHCGVGCQFGYGSCSGSVTPTPSLSPSIAPTYSIDDTCGSTSGACQPDNCCSEFGYCGTTEGHCGVGCQVGYGSCIASASPTPSISPGGPPTQCGNGVCEQSWLATGETCGNCPYDCGPCQPVSDVSGCQETDVIAMTFDDGPADVPTHTVLASLAQYNAIASFFVCGNRIEEIPSLLVQEVTSGYSIMSHTYDHPNLTTLAPQGVFDQMAKTQAAITGAGVCRKPTLMRPPFGEINEVVRSVTHRMGFRAVIWNLDTLDWQDAELNPGLVISNFNTNFAAMKAQGTGMLPLEHDLYNFTANIVGDILKTVTDSGVTQISLERCVWGPNYQRHPSWAYMYRFCSAGQDMVTWPVPTVSEPCPVSDWSEWSDCDVKCGSGSQTRVRLSLPPSLIETAAACGALSFIEQQSCTNTACPGTCTYSEWTNLGSCSQTCGGGTHFRTRSVTVGDDTCGAVLETQLCNTQACTSAARRALRG